jgi:hypothetical protein
MRTEEGGGVVGLGGVRRQRWQRGALLLLADTRRDREMGRARRSGENFFQAGETEWEATSERTRVEIFL